MVPLEYSSTAKNSKRNCFLNFSLTLTEIFVLRIESWPEAADSRGHEVESGHQELLQQRGAQHVVLHQRDTQFP